MRYYELSLTPNGASKPVRLFGSYPDGKYDPGALNIEFDIPVGKYDTPMGGVSITVHGVPLEDLTQAFNYKGMNFSLRAGMKAGFPLVNPQQAGVIYTGEVFQSFGNWEGTEMTLELVILAAVFTDNNPGNFVLNWLPGQALSEALKQTLSIAYPTMPISMNIAPDIINDYHFPHYCGTLDELAILVGDFTEDTFKNRVGIAIQGGQIVVLDKTYTPPPIQLVFTDFIGQPTWIASGVIQIKTVLRADLGIGSIVRMPQGLQNAPGVITQTSAALPSSIKYKSTFSGDFTVADLRHIGNLRSSDGASWCTIFNCVVNT